MYKGQKVTVYTVDKTEISLSRQDLVELINVCVDFYLLWPPCVADADIFALWFLLLLRLLPRLLLLLLSFFFPRLISAVADWMYAILLHMVWP